MASLQRKFIFILMERGEEDYYVPVGDTRCVKAIARTRGKQTSMVTKSYSHKAVQKIMYSKQEKDKKSREVHEAISKEDDKRREDEFWADPMSDKRDKKMKEKATKAEEKVKQKLEKMQIYDSEMQNGKKKSKHK